MRRLPSSWTSTLAALGYKRTRRRRADRHGRKLRSEALERREMLTVAAGDPLEDGGEAVAPQAVMPEYVLAGWGEDDSPETFSLATEYAADGTPTAVLSLTGDASAIAGNLQELTLELRAGASVLQSQEVLIDVASDAFVNKFYGARFDQAEASLPGDALPGDDAEPLGDLLLLLDADGTFPDLAGEANRLDETIDRLGQFAKLASASAEAGEPISSDGRAKLYLALDVATTEAEAERLSASTDAELAAAEQRAQTLQQAGLVMAQLAQADADSSDAQVAAAAQGAVDALFEASDSYHTLFAGYERNQELARYESEVFQAELVIGSSEEASYAAHEHLRVELGDALAMVQVTVVDGGSVAAAAALTTIGINAAADVTVDTNAQTVTGSDATLAVDANTESLLRLDLNAYAATAPLTAELVLHAETGGASKLAAHSDLWSLSAPAWDETLDWAQYSAEIAGGFGADLGAWTNPSADTYTVDVTEVVQRAALLGDSNLSGSFDYAGPAGDIESFYQAVTDWPAYEAQHLSGVRIDDPTTTDKVEGLVYRNDADGNGVVDASDRDKYFQRAGFLRADYNLDGVVDVRDYAILSANFDQPVSRFADGDSNLDGVVSTGDFNLFAGSLGISASAPTDLSATFQIGFDPGVGAASYVSTNDSSQPGLQPRLDVTFAPHVNLTGFSSSGGDLVVDYDVAFGDATNATLAVHQVVAGQTVHTVLSGYAVAGAEGAGYSETIDLSTVSGASLIETAEPYTLVATISSTNGLSRSRDFDGGLFEGPAGDWHALGTAADDTLEVGDGEIELTGGVSQTIALGALAAVTVHANLGGGDDTYRVRGGANLTEGVDLHVSDPTGFDTLDLGEWTTPAVNLAGAGPQSLTGGPHAVTLSLQTADSVEVVTAASGDTSAVAGPGYTTPFVVSSLIDEVDGDFGHGGLSLREAIDLVGQTPGNNTIMFDPSLFLGGKESIWIAAAGPNGNPFFIDTAVQIEGPGQDLLTISGDDPTSTDETRVFDVWNGGALTLSDLEVAGGRTSGGGDGAGIH
ncbi:MAG: hypothetical protein AAGB00_13280, partial [Planctomycetota bacterium]